MLGQRTVWRQILFKRRKNVDQGGLLKASIGSTSSMVRYVYLRIGQGHPTTLLPFIHNWKTTFAAELTVKKTRRHQRSAQGVRYLEQSMTSR